MRTPREILEAWQAGAITEAEAAERLETLKIRGGFTSVKHFVGYDYKRQCFVDTRDNIGLGAS